MRGQNYWERKAASRFSRRRVIQGMGVAGAAAVFGGAAIACGGDDDDSNGNGNGGGGGGATQTPQGNGQAPKRGGELIVRRPSGMSYGDPHRSTSGYDPTMSLLYAQPLLGMREGKVTPGLVESWEQIDENTITLKLRPDLKFTDDTPVNAEAIKYSIERQADPKVGAPRRSNLAGVSAEATEEFVATLKFENPNPTFFEFLTMNAPSGLGALVSPTAHQRMGDDEFNLNPVSVGPFRVERVSSDSDSIFVANPDWPITAPNGDKLPYLDRIVVKVIPQTAVAVAELQSGGIDIDYVFLGENVKQIEAQKDLAVSINKGAITQRIGMQMSKPPTNIEAFRKALAYAFDREEFAAVFTDGLGGPGRGPLTELTWAYDDSAPYYEYDEQKAREFLEQSGVDSNVQININTYTSGIYPRIGEMIQAQLRKLGLNLTVDNLELSVITERYRKNGEYSMGLTGGGAPQGDPWQYLESNFGSANQPGGTPVPEADELLQKALTKFDNEERKQVYQDLIKVGYEKSWVIWLLESPTIAGLRANVNGLEWQRTGSAVDVTAVWKS